MRFDTGPVVFLLAHPDDEFGVFPWIERALADGRPVRCVWMTDGGWGGQDIGRRQRESEHVLSAMGVPLDAMHFLGGENGFADGDLWNRLDEVIESLRARYRALAPSHIVVPAWEGGHPDHDASHLAGLALAAESGGEVLQYTLYQGEKLPGPVFRVLSPLPANGPHQTIAVSAAQRVRWFRVGFEGGGGPGGGNSGGSGGNANRGARKPNTMSAPEPSPGGAMAAAFAKLKKS